MLKTSARATALVLSVFLTTGTVAAANGLATQQYAAAGRNAQEYELTHMAMQRVEIVAPGAFQRVVVIGRRAA
ncbi:MAG TPA: hypothetical protein VIN75_17820 [Burkholderiaceae bacterium]